MKAFFYLILLSAINISYAQEAADKDEIVQDLICEVKGFTNRIENGEIVGKKLAKDMVSVMVKRQKEKYNITKKEIYIRMHPLKGGLEKIDYAFIVGRYKEKSEDMYWDLSNNDAYEVKQVYTSLKSPDSLSTVYIDKIKGTILFKKFNINEPSQFRHLRGNCKPKDTVKILK